MPDRLRPSAGPIPEESRRREHEQRDLRVRTLFVSLGVLAAVVVIAAAGMWLFQRVADERARVREVPTSPLIEPVTPPQPRLESSSGEVLRQLHAAEAVELGGYQWVDRQAGIARLPIERAMEIIAERDGELPQAMMAPSGEETGQ